MRICRSTSSTGSSNGRAGGVGVQGRGGRTSGGMIALLHPLRGPSRLLARDHPERGADRHADAGGVSLAEHVAGHHLARGEEIGAGAAAEMHRGALVDLEAEVRERDARPQRVAGEGRRVDRSRPVRLRGRQALRSAVVERRVIERAGPARGVVGIERAHERFLGRGRARGRAPAAVAAVVPGNTGGMKRPIALASMIEWAIWPGCSATSRPQIA